MDSKTFKRLIVKNGEISVSPNLTSSQLSSRSLILISMVYVMMIFLVSFSILIY